MAVLWRKGSLRLCLITNYVINIFLYFAALNYNITSFLLITLHCNLLPTANELNFLINMFYLKRSLNINFGGKICCKSFVIGQQ